MVRPRVMFMAVFDPIVSASSSRLNCLQPCPGGQVLSDPVDTALSPRWAVPSRYVLCPDGAHPWEDHVRWQH